MRPKIATMLFFVIFFLTEGCGATVLNRISRVQNGGSVQFLAFFDETPVFDATFSGKRLDLTMQDTVVQSDFVPPEADSYIVRTLLAEDRDNLVLSIFFRYSPQHMSVDAGPAESVAITLVPGNRFTKTYQQLTSSLGSIQTVKNDPATTVGPLTFSRYAGNWRLFLQHYHDLAFIDLTPRIYFPPFPLTALLPRDQAPFRFSFSHADAFSGSDWFSALADVQKRLKDSTNEQERQFLALTYADLLYRLGNNRAALEQFDLLQKRYGDSDVGKIAAYADIVIEAQNEHFYKAQILLQRVLEQETSNSALASFMRLSLAECFLATGQHEEAQPYLADAISLPEKAAIRKDIRQADLFFAARRFQQASIILASHADSIHIQNQPYSLNNYCTLLYRQEEFEQSALCYQRLESRLFDRDKQASARYLAALSQLQAETDTAVDSVFEELINRFPGSKVALRAAIKRADLCYLRQPDCSAEALSIYQAVAEASFSRDISLEARFKEALINHLSGDDNKAVAVLVDLLRNFQSGRLRNEALALLIETLPIVLSDLLEQNQDIAALSLARQNRFLFANDWIDHSFLFQLGLALERLSLNRDALNLFLYLKRFADFQLDDELIFALIRVSHALTDPNLVEDFSSTYLLQFPDGKHRQDALYYLLDSSLTSGRIERAVQLLPDPLPQRRDFRLLAASIYFFADNHRAAAELLLQLDKFSELSGTQRFMLAESLFRTDRREMCRELYEYLLESGPYKDLARYRLTQIVGENINEDRTHAISKLFEVDTVASYWHRLFEQQQRFDQLSQPF